MKQINIYLIMLILLSSFSFAFSLDYPAYLDINETETIKIYGKDIDDSYIAHIHLGATEYIMNSEDDYYSIGVSSGIKEDTLFYVHILNGTEYNSTGADDSLESELIINNNSIHVIKRDHKHTHLNQSEIDYFFCLYADTIIPRQVQLLYGYNLTNGTNYWYEGDIIEVGNVWDYYCGNIDVIYQHDKINFTDYIGFSCLNCDVKSLTLGIDETNIMNKTWIFLNDSILDSEGYFEDIGNYMFDFTGLSGNYVFEDSGILKFRDPFYVTINLYHDGLNTSLVEPYTNDFQYIFLQSDGITSSTSWMDGDWIEFNWIDKYFYPIIGLEYTPATTIDTTPSFWGDYNNGGATIKLYEADNYSVNLETTKSKSSIGRASEFVYPQATDSEYIHEILNLNINNETDQTITIFIDQYEISSFKFMMNLIQNSILVLLWLVIVILVAMFSRDAKVTSIIAVVTFTLLLKLLGV